MIEKDINKQIEHYQFLLNEVVVSYKRNYSYIIEDIAQIGLIGLWNALETFRSDEGILFEVYAKKVIRNGINSFLRTEKRINNATCDKSIDDMLESERVEKWILELNDSKNESAVSKYEGKELKELLVSGFDEDENKILNLLLQGYKRKEMAEQLNWNINKFYYIFKKLKIKARKIIDLWRNTKGGK